MNYNFTKRMVAVVSIVGALYLSSGCGKYEEGPELSLMSKKARVTGEWEVTKMLGDDGEEYDMGNMDMTWTFEKDGSFASAMTFEYGGVSYTYDEKGEWEFSEDKEELDIEIDGDVESFEILRLSNKEMFLELDDMRIEFEKK